jgi:hypothetical protein
MNTDYTDDADDLVAEEFEDIALIEAIKEGMATPDVSRSEIFGILALDE